MNISIAGIIDNLIDFKVYAAVYCELSMAITMWGKTPLCVLALDPLCRMSKKFQPIPGPVCILAEDFVHSITVCNKDFHGTSLKYSVPQQ